MPNITFNYFPLFIILGDPLAIPEKTYVMGI